MKLLLLLARLPRPALALGFWLLLCGVAPVLVVLVRTTAGLETPFAGVLPLVALVLAVLGVAVFEPPRKLSFAAWRVQLAHRGAQLRLVLAVAPKAPP